MPGRSCAPKATSRAAASRAPDVGEDGPGRVSPRAAGDSAPGMCAGPAQVETADLGKPVARVAEERPPGEELIEGVLAVHRVPAAEAVLPLEVRGRDDVASDDRLRDTGCVRLERLHGRIHDAIACCLVPVRVTEMPRRVLEQRGDDVGAFGSERRVGEGRDRRLEIGLRGDPAVLRVVECSLEVVEARSDDDSPAQRSSSTPRTPAGRPGRASPSRPRRACGCSRHANSGSDRSRPGREDARGCAWGRRSKPRCARRSPRRSPGRRLPRSLAWCGWPRRRHRIATSRRCFVPRRGAPRSDVRPAPGEDGTPRRSST